MTLFEYKNFVGFHRAGVLAVAFHSEEFPNEIISEVGDSSLGFHKH